MADESETDPITKDEFEVLTLIVMSGGTMTLNDFDAVPYYDTYLEFKGYITRGPDSEAIVTPKGLQAVKDGYHAGL